MINLTDSKICLEKSLTILVECLLLSILKTKNNLVAHYLNDQIKNVLKWELCSDMQVTIKQNNPTSNRLLLKPF